jgi:hypothetical protein
MIRNSNLIGQKSFIFLLADFHTNIKPGKSIGGYEYGIYTTNSSLILTLSRPLLQALSWLPPALDPSRESRRLLQELSQGFYLHTTSASTIHSQPPWTFSQPLMAVSWPLLALLQPLLSL